MISYWNLRLLRRDIPGHYRGVTHEYMDLAGWSAENLQGASFIDHATGANRIDKFARDMHLLQTALATETDLALVGRYTFYLANTLRDKGDLADALPVYMRRAELGFWHEEVYMSLLNAARLKETLGHPGEDVIQAYIDAAAACPARAEALHDAARYCRNHGQPRRGYELALAGLAIPAPDVALFSEDWIYDYGLLDEYAVNAYWAGYYRNSFDACLRLLGKQTLPIEHKDRVTRNLAFAKAKLDTGDGSVTSTAVAAIQSTLPHWRPNRPLAGTELMVEALCKRLGTTLDGIDLRVNLYDPATRDGRPLVVWIHHDIDQAAVQWCRDTALTEPVICFVFVSYWQRERYLAAFGLRPERCTVIKHAMDPAREPRRWEPAPVFRCAYTSTPFRGLDVLLDAWEHLPPERAELHIWSSMKLYVADDRPYRHLFERARAMPGVTYHGLAPNEELRAALRTMHFLTYPNTFAETACLSVMEAMSAGCRVIVPSYGVLPETTGGYARVYPWCADPARHAAIFAETLAEEFAAPWDGRPEESLDQQIHCARIFAWERRLGEWHRLIASLRADHAPAALARSASAPHPAPAAQPVAKDTPMLQGITRLRDRGYTPAGVIDIGAHDGDFSRLARSVFPEARILMVEALPEKAPILEGVAGDLGNAAHVITLLGEEEKTATPFFVIDTDSRPDLVKTGSSTFRENSDFPMIELAMRQRRLDAVVAEIGMPLSFLKLDVQGAELSVLRGLGERLSEVEVILTEMSLLDYNAGAPSIAEVVADLSAKGFILFDIVGEHRYRDGSLIQIDGLFLRPGSRFRPQPPFWTA